MPGVGCPNDDFSVFSAQVWLKMYKYLGPEVTSSSCVENARKIFILGGEKEFLKGLSSRWSLCISLVWFLQVLAMIFNVSEEITFKDRNDLSIITKKYVSRAKGGTF